MPSVNLLTLKLDACCSVVSHVPTVHSHRPPQKKGVRPGDCLSKIKHVKGVFSVNPCCSVPIAPNVPNAVVGQNVGGRLQQFWHMLIAPMWQHVIKILTICCFSWINGYHKFCKIEIMKEQYTENEKNSLSE